MDRGVSASTLHFPAGTYTLEDSDDHGRYYRAQSPVIKHSFAGAQPYDGGIFVNARDPQRLRGYLIWAGGRTHVGDFSAVAHTFRN